MTVLQTAGLSHSETRGSKVICTYPRIIAAYHVLHRLQEPRHPPYALEYFVQRMRNTTKGMRRGPVLGISVLHWIAGGIKAAGPLRLIHIVNSRSLFQLNCLCIMSWSEGWKHETNIILHPVWRITDSNR